MALRRLIQEEDHEVGASQGYIKTLSQNKRKQKEKQHVIASWYICIIPALGRLMQQDCGEFEFSLYYRVLGQS